MDVLPDFARLVIERYQGQVVIMGSLVDPTIKSTIDRLQEMSRKSALFKSPEVYTVVKADQLDPLVGVEARKGDVIRFASDFTLVPSIQEACGLVPIEAFAMGSGVLTSYVHGLKDLCKPLDRQDLQGQRHDLATFTCVAFDREDELSQTVSNLNGTLERFLNQWNALSDANQKTAQERWIQEARSFRWDLQAGAMDQYKALYLRAMQPDSTQEAQLRESLKDTYIRHYTVQ